MVLSDMKENNLFKKKQKHFFFWKDREKGWNANFVTQNLHFTLQESYDFKQTIKTFSAKFAYYIIPRKR